MEYTLICPNAIVNKKKGINVTTSFTYRSKEEALEHKKASDKWAKAMGKEPQSYIVEECVVTSTCHYKK